MRLDFGGRRALVTGGANGIGRAAAALLVQCGAGVWIADLPAENPEAAASAIGARALLADVTDARSLEAAFDACHPLDVVIVNAGIVLAAPVEAVSREDWDRTLAVNLGGAFLTLQQAARRMKPRRQGAIVLTASTNSFDGEANLAAYNATKAALLGLLHTAANELGPWGIRVNAVCPGYIRTRLTAEGYGDPGFIREYFRHLPLGRGGEPEEVARAIVFLASPLASYITGAHLFVDGGQMAAKFGVWDEKTADFVSDHWKLKPE